MSDNSFGPSVHEMTGWKALFEKGLAEDGLPWDWTTLGLGRQRASRPARARVVAKSGGVWAAGPLVGLLGFYGISARTSFSDGKSFREGDVLCDWKGEARAILALERTFLNLAAYACGIATRTSGFVRIVRAACPKRTPRVTPTRKILPGFRDLAIHAVRAGGGFPHRVNLSSGVLIKENHVAAAGGIARAIEGARAVAPHGLRIEIEVRDLMELAEALSARAEIVLLDNFAPAQVRSALKKADSAPQRPIIEVSGGLDEDSIASYALPGVDILSIGSLTHSVRSSDLSLLVE